jgi:hypothetical protein
MLEIDYAWSLHKVEVGLIGEPATTEEFCPVSKNLIGFVAKAKLYYSRVL